MKLRKLGYKNARVDCGSRRSKGRNLINGHGVAINREPVAEPRDSITEIRIGSSLRRVIAGSRGGVLCVHIESSDEIIKSKITKVRTTGSLPNEIFLD